ncbi:hypothetical protein DETS111669_32535 [Delftia tsuruhatensis]
MQLRRLLSHLCQHFLGRVAPAQVRDAAQPIFLDLGRHLRLAHGGHLVEDLVQLRPEHAAQAVVAQHLVVQHAGRVGRRVQLAGQQVGLAAPVEALGRTTGAAAALAQIRAPRRIGNGRVVHVERHHHLGAVAPALADGVHRLAHLAHRLGPRSIGKRRRLRTHDAQQVGHLVIGQALALGLGAPEWQFLGALHRSGLQFAGAGRRGMGALAHARHIFPA